MELAGHVEVDFGGGQSAKVHFSVSRRLDDQAPQVGLKAVETMAGDIVDTLTADQQEFLKEWVLAHLRGM